MKIWDSKEHRSLENEIFWFNHSWRLLAGHTQELPRSGDIITYERGSFKFVRVMTTGDPSDMWFAFMAPVPKSEKGE